MSGVGWELYSVSGVGWELYYVSGVAWELYYVSGVGGSYTLFVVWVAVILCE